MSRYAESPFGKKIVERILECAKKYPSVNSTLVAQTIMYATTGVLPLENPYPSTKITTFSETDSAFYYLIIGNLMRYSQKIAEGHGLDSKLFSEGPLFIMLNENSDFDECITCERILSATGFCSQCGRHADQIFQYRKPSPIEKLVNKLALNDTDK